MINIHLKKTFYKFYLILIKDNSNKNRNSISGQLNTNKEATVLSHLTSNATTNIILPMNHTNTNSGTIQSISEPNQLNEPIFIQHQDPVSSQAQNQSRFELIDSQNNFVSPIGQKRFISIGYSDLSNIDTLATVAAAQSNNSIPPNTIPRQKTKVSCIIKIVLSLIQINFLSKEH